MKLSEGAMQGDLKRLVTPEVHVDEYKSKMGEDDDIIVVSFKVTGKDAATELVNFLESGYDFVLDADISTGEISPDNFLVFVELSRRSYAIDQIFKMVEEMLNLTEQCMDEWTFTYGKIENKYKIERLPVTKQMLAMKIPTSPKEYRDTIGVEEETEESVELPPQIQEPAAAPGQDDDEIASLKTDAGLPVNQTAPNDDYTNALKTMSGQM